MRGYEFLSSQERCRLCRVELDRCDCDVPSFSEDGFVWEDSPYLKRD